MAAASHSTPSASDPRPSILHRPSWLSLCGGGSGGLIAASSCDWAEEVDGARASGPHLAEREQLHIGEVSGIEDPTHVDPLTHARSAEVWLVRYDLRSRDVPVRAGENGRPTLPHRHIVRQLVGLGT